MTIVSNHAADLPEGFLPPQEPGQPPVLRKSIRDRIKAVKPYTSEVVTVDEWEADIEVRSLTLGERNAMIQGASQEDGDADISTMYPMIIIASAFDPETGEKVFAPDDIGFIQALPAHLADKLALPAMRLSGMTDKAVDDEAKKSSTTEDSE